MKKRTIFKLFFFLLLSLHSCRNLNRCCNQKATLQSMLYLCYITNEPTIIDFKTIDTNITKLIEYKIGKQSDNYQIIKIQVRPVDLFLGQKTYDDIINVNNAMNKKTSLDNFLKKFNAVYFICKKGERSLKNIKKEYENKRLILIDYAHLFQNTDSTSTLITFDILYLKKRNIFDHLLKIE